MKKIIYILTALIISFFCKAQTKQLDLGDKIPSFTLPNQNGKNFSMKDSIGAQMLVIFFYPKGENMLCKKELRVFSDSIANFNKAEALVIGISENSVQKNKKFYDENKLKYDLLSDSDGVVLKTLGIKENMFSDRITYVVNIAGEVVFKNYSLINGKKHATEALKFLHQMNQ
jgi:peroxiredoxin Q/BCP